MSMAYALPYSGFSAKCFERGWSYLARLFRSKSRAIVITAASMLSSSWKTLNKPITQKVLKIPTTKLDYFFIMKRCSCNTRTIILKATFLSYVPFNLNVFFGQNCLLQTSVDTTRGVLVLIWRLSAPLCLYFLHIWRAKTWKLFVSIFRHHPRYFHIESIKLR